LVQDIVEGHYIWGFTLWEVFQGPHDRETAIIMKYGRDPCAYGWANRYLRWHDMKKALHFCSASPFRLSKP